MLPRSAARRLVLATALLAAVFAGGADADAYDERRLRTGARLFRTLVAAVLDLESRRDADGRLLLVVYGSAAGAAREAAELIAREEGSGGGEGGATGIRGFDLEIETTADASFAAYLERRPAAIFLAEAPAEAVLERIVRFGIEQGVVVYSPFEGHVEKGVLGGFSVEARVRPFVNRRTLEASGVELKPFFLKVAKVHG